MYMEAIGVNEGQDINAIRMAAVDEQFRNSIGKRALILMAEVPFLIIGKIAKVESDYVFIDVESTHIDQLEGKLFRIHLDRIMSFYIEKNGRPIPSLKLDSSSSAKRGDD
jgi:hypothetical protein